MLRTNIKPLNIDIRVTDFPPSSRPKLTKIYAINEITGSILLIQYLKKRDLINKIRNGQVGLLTSYSRDGWFGALTRNGAVRLHSNNKIVIGQMVYLNRKKSKLTTKHKKNRPVVGRVIKGTDEDGSYIVDFSLCDSINKLSE